MRSFLSVLTLVLFLALPLGAEAQNDPIPTYTPWLTDKTYPPPSPPAQYDVQNEDIETDKTPIEPLSALENMYAQRISGEAPKQFGYDIFGEAQNDTPLSNTPMGAVQDDYVLGQGDDVMISFTGQRTDHGTYNINPSGTILISDLPPLPAAGQTIKQFRDNLNAHLQKMHNTAAYVSLSSVRQIGVLVVGNVKEPGRKTLNMFHTALDALNQSGGVDKDGSLRNIKLVRGGRSITIDLYDLLMSGAPHIDLRLKDGDRIVVPPIGPTIAIAGAVKRPGIYEIRKSFHGLKTKSHTDNSEKLSLTAMLNLSGGLLSPTAQNRFLKLEPLPNGEERVSDITNFSAVEFYDGTILSVTSGQAKKTGEIELLGHTRYPGLYDLSSHKTLSALLNDGSILGDDIYPLAGVIERWNKEQFSSEFIIYPTRFVFNNEFDLSLQNNDKIILLSNEDISTLYDDIEDAGKTEDTHIPQALKNFLKEHSVYVRGAVRKPGRYPIAEGITLENILSVVGGVTLEANTESIEVTSKNFGEGHQAHGRAGTIRTIIDLNTTAPSSVRLSAGDTVRANQTFRKMDEKTVQIIGEVLHPGEYDILSGDRVSDLLERAGGLTNQAYPKGTIFSRESERKAEELRFRNAAHQMEQRLAAAIERDKNAPNATQIEMVRELADELTSIEAVGRITVETDPAVLETSPELDMYLEKGDRIYIPKRPLSVRVNGEVLSPAALQFRKDKDPIDYIHEAGGFTYHADKDRTFVLHPDGSAQPLRVNTWNHTPVFIPPGSTIIVPRDPKPFDFMESAKDIGQILSNLAITSVFIDDIRD